MPDTARRAARGYGRDMSGSDWRGLIRGMLRFFAEEARESEHAEDAEYGTPTSVPRRRDDAD
jgi:hypothetical protein